jgi:hypothetical protein
MSVWSVTSKDQSTGLMERWEKAGTYQFAYRLSSNPLGVTAATAGVWTRGQKYGLYYKWTHCNGAFQYRLPNDPVT